MFHQVPKMFPKTFPIAPHVFPPYCLAMVPTNPMMYSVTHTFVATNLNCFAEVHAYMIKQQAIVIAVCNEHTEKKLIIDR
jgi:hypothetical protein